MQRALRSAQLRPQDIDWISAHGTATQLNDKYETTAIKEVFGEYAYQMPITSTKPMTGHMMGATGALEVIFGIKAIETGMIPPTINYAVPDPECDLDYVPNVARAEARGHLHEQRLWFWRAQCRVDLETLCRLTAGIDYVAGIVPTFTGANMSRRSFPWSRTFILGFGFFGISIVWPVFNSFIPPMLEQLGLTSLVIGFIMTWDNIINVC